MRWNQMRWTDRIAELLVYATAAVCCNFAIFSWSSVSNAIYEKLQEVDGYLADFVSYFTLLSMLSVILLISFSVIRRIKNNSL